jgi:hypothetical protein
MTTPMWSCRRLLAVQSESAAPRTGEKKMADTFTF